MSMTLRDAFARPIVAVLIAGQLAVTSAAADEAPPEPNILTSCDTTPLAGPPTPPHVEANLRSIAGVLQQNGLLDTEMVGDLLASGDYPAPITQSVANWQAELERQMETDIHHYGDYQLGAIQDFSAALLGYLAALQTIYTDDPHVQAALDGLAPDRHALQDLIDYTDASELAENCETDGKTMLAQQGEGNHAPPSPPPVYAF